MEELERTVPMGNSTMERLLYFKIEYKEGEFDIEKKANEGFAGNDYPDIAKYYIDDTYSERWLKETKKQLRKHDAICIDFYCSGGNNYQWRTLHGIRIIKGYGGLQIRYFDGNSYQEVEEWNGLEEKEILTYAKEYLELVQNVRKNTAWRIIDEHIKKNKTA